MKSEKDVGAGVGEDDKDEKRRVKTGFSES